VAADCLTRRPAGGQVRLLPGQGTRFPLPTFSGRAMRGKRSLL
jgi:hypothetical protein